MAGPLHLPPGTTSFQAWARNLHSLARTDALAGELRYWRNQLEAPRRGLPRDEPNGRAIVRFAESLTTSLDRESTQQLLKETSRAYETQTNDLLLTALARVLCQWSGDDSVVINMEGHGREDLPGHTCDLSRTVGWVSTLYPVRLTPGSEEDPGASLRAIVDQLRAVPNSGVGYGLLKYLADEPVRAQLRDLPKPKVTFNNLGQFDPSFEPGNALFTPANERSGRTRSDEAPLGSSLLLGCRVYGGQLWLTWTYSSEMYHRATIEKLSRAYLQSLHALISDCVARAKAAREPGCLRSPPRFSNEL